MAITDQTLRIDSSIRVRIARHVDDATRQLVSHWIDAWALLSPYWIDVMDAIAAEEAAGRTPTVTQLLAKDRTLAALIATRRALEDLSRIAGITILSDLDVLTEYSATQQLRLITSQLPTGEAAAALRASLIRADPAQIAAIVARTTQQVTSFASTMTDIGVAAIRSELIYGVQLGFGPRKTAGRMFDGVRMVEDLHRVFNFTLNRALVISRTETLDAHRAAAALGQQANADVLQGWMWLAQLDTRTCPSCWSQSGSIHPLSESGPDDHQQGRCARMPVAKPWKELGFAIPEPPPVVPDAQEVFAGLSEAEQVAIMGKQRLAMLQDGRLSWDELSLRRTTPGWRDSYGVRPLRNVKKSRLRVV